MAVSTRKARKATYKVTNWRQYNESLVRRGDITLWLDDEVLEKWQHDNAERKVGHPYVYSDLAMEALLTLRELFRLPYRQTEGLGRALATLMKAEIAIPNFTSLQKRAAKLKVVIAIGAAARGPLQVVVDSSGVKVYGEGEWRVRCYGVERRRTWRKLHLAVDPQTQEIVAQVLTTNQVGDAGQVVPLLDQIKRPVEKCYGDGGYDHRQVFNTLAQRQIQPVIAIRKNASIQQHGPCPPAARRMSAGDPALRPPRMEAPLGLPPSQPRRNPRLKRRFGDTFKNRHLENQKTEAALRCKLLNHFTTLGLPKFVWNN